MPLQLSQEAKKIFKKPLIKRTDMTFERQNEAIEVITQAVDKYATTKQWEQAAKNAKEQLDKKYGTAWHVCIGEGFGFDVTFHAKSLLYIYYGENIGILAYKA